MKGVIILAHGSKRKETTETLDSLVRKVRSQADGVPVCPAYLQFAEPNLEAAVTQLAEQGITEIKVVPLFIFDGIHVTQDIPAELAKLQGMYPDVHLSLTKHLGDDDRITEIVMDRIQQ